MSQDDFPVVGIGASAGGLEALTALLRWLPPKPGLAVVVVQHLSPGSESRLAQILSGACRLVVREVTGTLPIVPDQVYVIPPGFDLSVRDSKLILLKRRQD